MTDQQRLARQEQWRSPEAASHFLVLGVCLGILAAGLVLTPPGPKSPSLRLGSIELPDVCLWRATTGIPCPGCGMTRSIVAALHGSWSASLAYHRLGWVTLLYVILQMISRLAWLGFPGAGGKLHRGRLLLDRALLPLVVVLFVNWVAVLAG